MTLSITPATYQTVLHANLSVNLKQESFIWNPLPKPTMPKSQSSASRAVYLSEQLHLENENHGLMLMSRWRRQNIAIMEHFELIQHLWVFVVFQEMKMKCEYILMVYVILNHR